MHPLLQRQLKRLGLGVETPPDAVSWQTLLSRVDKAYADADLDRYTLERSLELSSGEMRVLYSNLETIVSSLSEALLVTDELGRIVMLNIAAESLLGWDASDCRGRPIVEVLPSAATRCATAGARGDVVHTRRDGSRFAGSLTVTELVRDGEKRGQVYLLHDRTERLRFEEELIRARDLAQDANRSKSEFLANMSHEIRTPMNGVIGTASLLLDTDLTVEQREYVETIRSSGDLLLSILNDILDLSKIEAGKIEIDLHAFDPQAAIEDTIELFSASAERRGNEIIYDVAANVPRQCVGDLTRIRQVLSNLLSNAIKFTERGEIVVQARVVEHDADTVDFSLVVRDSGVGIPPDRLGKLFRPFVQADASVTRRFGGSGLGLAISRLLVERMGGRMWVESEVGKGSTFGFSLPLQRGHTDAVVDDVRTPFGAGRAVLLVDDNATNRRVLGGQLTAFGFAVTAVDSARAAMERLEHGGPFVAAVLDQMMPEEDGVTLAQRVHAMPAFAKLPLLLLGSGVLPQRGAVFAAVLRKPCLPRLLRDVLRRQVDGCGDVSAPVRRTIPRLADEKPLRILIAEDVAVNQKLVVRLLEKLGYRADCVGNGLEAVEAVRRTDYDVVLMDCMMPELDGLQATRAIRAMRSPGSPWVIAVTANVMTGERERCFEAGMNDFVAKPIRLDAMIDALRAVPEA